jgi:hypothetical protein
MSNFKNIIGHYNGLPVLNKTESFADPIINDGKLSWEKVHISPIKFENHLVLKCPLDIVYDGFGQEFLGQRVIEQKTQFEKGDNIQYYCQGSWHDGVINTVYNTNEYDINYDFYKVALKVNKKLILGYFDSGLFFIKILSFTIHK